MQLFIFGGINVYLSQTPGTQPCGPQLCVLFGAQSCVPMKNNVTLVAFSHQRVAFIQQILDFG